MLKVRKIPARDFDRVRDAGRGRGVRRQGTASSQPLKRRRQFLKLRGYDFDEPSFFRSAAAGDAMAVNGFISAGINVNAHDGNGDTVLTSAAARGDLPDGKCAAEGRRGFNAKGRSGWTALPVGVVLRAKRSS